MKLETNYTLTLPGDIIVILSREELDALWRELQKIYGYASSVHIKPTDINDMLEKLKPAPAVVKPPWSPSPTFPRDTPQPYMKDL